MNALDAVRAAGVVGEGGAGFPTHVKLNAHADVLIVNAAECEPLIETDKYLLRTRAEELLDAMNIAGDLVGASRRVIALKSKYKTEIACVRHAMKSTGLAVEIHEMDTFYPAGDEQMMVLDVLGIPVPERDIPLKVGAVVNNVGTLLSLRRAVRRGLPVTGKILSVVGAVNTPLMLSVPIGTPVRACVEAAVPAVADWAVIMGGPMMGKVISDPADIDRRHITKTDGNILVLSRSHPLIANASLTLDRMARQARNACIQCRMCTDLCPRQLSGHHLRPHLVMRNLYRLHQPMDNDMLEQSFGEAVNCCECGICEKYACPMMLSPCRVNTHVKYMLQQRGINPPKNTNPIPRPEQELRRVPTSRLIARLGLSAYEGMPPQRCLTLTPDFVRVALQQHIGAQACPVVSPGDVVSRGDLLGDIPDRALGARIHASVDGVVTHIEDGFVRIQRRGTL